MSGRARKSQAVTRGAVRKQVWLYVRQWLEFDAELTHNIWGKAKERLRKIRKQRNTPENTGFYLPEFPSIPLFPYVP